MPTFRTTFYFENIQNAEPRGGSSSAVAWSETWYQEATSVEDALRFAMNPANYVSRRMAFLATDYRMTWVRVSSVTLPNQSKVGDLGISARGGEPAQVNCAVLVDFTRLPGDVPQNFTSHRRMLFRGLPRTMIDSNVIRVSSVAYRNLIVFLNYLGRAQNVPPAGANLPFGPWLMQIKNGAQSYTPITGLTIDPTSDRRILVNSSLQGAQPVGTRFNIKGVKFPAFINRVWTVVRAPVGGQADLLGQNTRRMAGTWTEGGQIRLNTHVYLPPNQYLIIGLRNKKTGGLLRPTRGRRRRA